MAQEDRSIGLTETEIAWLDEHRDDLRLGHDPNFPPLEYLNEQGQYVGFSADLVAIIEKRLGLRFKRMNFSSWKDLLEAAKSGQVDFITEIAETPERIKYLKFTRPYLSVPQVIVVRDSIKKELRLADLKGLRVGVVSGYAIHELLQNQYPDMDLVPLVDERMGLMKLSVKEIDAMVLFISSASYFINEMGLAHLRIAGDSGYTFKFCMATPKDSPVLAAILQKALDSISKEEIEEIYRKWVVISRVSIFESRRFWVGVSFVLSLLLALIGFVAIRNRLLRRQVEEKTYELRKTKNDLVVIYNSIQSALIGLSNSGRILQFNDAAKRYFAERTVLAGMGFWEAVPFLVKYRDLCNQVLQSGQACELHKEKVSLGDVEYVNIFFIPVYFEKEAGVLLRIDDVTEMEQKEQQLRQAQKMEMVGTLAGGIAHDFNNALAGIIGTLSLLSLKLVRGDSIDKETLQRHVRMMEESCQRAVDMVQHLLMLSRKQETVFSAVDLRLCLQHVNKICTSTFDRSVQIKAQLPEEAAYILADATQLEQSLLNICINALHSMTLMRAASEPRGGELKQFCSRVEAASCEQLSRQGVERGSFWRICIADTGVGIAKHVLPRIFEPFFSTKKRGEGTGLGLAMVYNIIKEHKGYIHIESEEGVGTEFNLYLPCYQPQPGELSSATLIAEVPRGSGTILVADDDKIVREIAGSILLDLGYKVIYAEDGEEAVRVYQEKHQEIAAVLLDVVMPKKSGLEAYKMMKEVSPHVKAVICSGFKQDERVSEALAAGAKAFLQKPYSYHRLGLEIFNLLKV